MMSCGTSSRYGSSLLLKKADFSIQGDLFIRQACSSEVSGCARREKTPPPSGEGVTVDGLLRGLFKGTQHGIATRHRGVERCLGGLLPGECRLDLLGPDVAHLHH